MTLKIDPVGYAPAITRSVSGAAGLLVVSSTSFWVRGWVNIVGSKVGNEPSPRISPVSMFIVMKPPGSPLSAIAASPASWTPSSIVSFRLSPGTGRCETSLPSGVGWPRASTWIRVIPGLPRSQWS